MKKSMVKGVALVAASVLGITGLSLAPANAATRTVAVVQETNTLSGLNTAIPGKNLVTNVDVLYPTGAGFTYWNNKAQLVRNTAFGTFKITKNETHDFRVTYTIKKGLKWSDGTLITGQDLLLSHAISSSKWSVAAGMGDPSPANGDDPTNKFDSAGYGGPYDDHTIADSYDLSDDNYSVTVRYDSFQPDWQIFGPGPTDVAALVALAKGKKVLQSARTNAAYKNLFEDAYYNAYEALPASNDEDYQDALDARTASRALLTQIAKKWSTVWNITTVTANTNPLLLISNGGFMIDTINSTSATLKRNPLASVSGAPKVTGNIDTFVFKFPASGATFNDVAAAQALANKEIDAYSGAANAAVWSTLKANSNATTIQASSATYEHLDIRTGTANTGANPDCAATYTGPFAGESQKAKDLRHAFMLVVPRQLIANTYVGKVFDPNTTANSPVLQSNLLLTTEGNYAKQVAGLKTYVDEFSKTQAERNALALALVKKYYSNAGPGTNNIDVNYLRNNSARRADINLQIKLEAAKVGFNVTNVGNGAWPNFLDCNDYDVADFAWSRSSISQTGNNAQYITLGGNNGYGWSDPAVDSAFNVFEGALSATELVTASVNAEKLLYSHYWSLPLYQWPGVASWNSDLKGILYNPLNPNLVWNYWAWTY
jgi:peptide/nickel transport system substrate-binding protein